MLVGGLGMGFTLRATLDLLPPGAMVRVVELVPAVVEWNRGPLGAIAGHPLNDRRVRVEIGDVGFTLRANPGGFDAILLDVDNGPSAFTTPANEGLYDNSGVAASYAALRAGGALAVWSAWEDRKFEQRLRFHGFVAQVDRVRARLKKGGARHTIFLGLKHAEPSGRPFGRNPGHRFGIARDHHACRPRTASTTGSRDPVAGSRASRAGVSQRRSLRRSGMSTRVYMPQAGAGARRAPGCRVSFHAPGVCR